VIELALITGISPSQWAEEGGRSIVTALELLEERNKPAPEPVGGIQYSG
jgi:hypothetical protein